MLKVTGLHKNFKAVMAVNNISLEISAGEFFSLIGPNGSGKTTLIKMITGLLQPTSGRIEVNDIDQVAEPKKAKAVIGYIPDEPRIWPSITGEEFLHFAGAFYGMEPQIRQKKIDHYLSLFQLSGIEENYFENYSRGNKQKFSIIAALMHEPKLLLIDEPITGLDPDSVDTVDRLFSQFTKAGGTVLMATHTLSFAETISDRVGLLKQGKILETGTVDDLRRRAGLEKQASLHEVYKKIEHPTK